MNSYAQYYSGTSGKGNQQSFLSNQPYQQPSYGAAGTPYGKDALDPNAMPSPPVGTPRYKQYPQTPVTGNYDVPQVSYQQPRMQMGGMAGSAPYRKMQSAVDPQLLQDPGYLRWLRTKKRPGYSYMGGQQPTDNDLYEEYMQFKNQTPNNSFRYSF